MPVATKNALGAGTDLGLGDQLVQQLQDQEDARKKSPDQTLAGSVFGGGAAGGQGSLLAARSLGLV